MSEINEWLADHDHPAARDGDIEWDNVEAFATVFGMNITRQGYAHCVLEPGDSTRYEIIGCRRSADDMGTEFLVASNFAPAYAWRGNVTVHPDYATEHWGGATKNTWTGVIMAAFLNWAGHAVMTKGPAR